jgi:hypothetical protein
VISEDHLQIRFSVSYYSRSQISNSLFGDLQTRGLIQMKSDSLLSLVIISPLVLLVSFRIFKLSVYALSVCKFKILIQKL